jgi:hypothetical protein
VRVSLRSRWVRAAVRAARHRPTANTTEIPPSTTLSDLLERVRLGQSKRATVNRAEHIEQNDLKTDVTVSNDIQNALLEQLVLSPIHMYITQQGVTEKQ